MQAPYHHKYLQLPALNYKTLFITIASMIPGTPGNSYNKYIIGFYTVG